MKTYHFRCPIHRYTFQVKKIRDFVEKNCKGKVLNLFCGPTLLSVDECRNDLDENVISDYKKEALDFIREWEGYKFDTIILDPPYSFRKSMELYEGRKNSRFKLVLDEIPKILNKGGKVITLGYQSIVMGKNRGFDLTELAIFSHGGAIHDTLCSVEVFK